MTRTFGFAVLTAVTLVAGTAAASAGEYGPGGYGYGGQVTSTYAYRDSFAWAPGPVYEEGYVAVAPGPYDGPGWGTGYNGTNHPTPSSTQGDVGPGGNNNGTRSGYYRQW
ncbi:MULTISPECIES: hypothetical protein [unclassified Bradyrhizobium]|uniref:hypothetical protein n=1 Tax=unclassified Bradyrhizobium TaxID=2631580 RepID=UPI0028E66D33|nr:MULTISPECIES: hypothetical protein [unclassified Bradyrhizobium]